MHSYPVDYEKDLIKKLDEIKNNSREIELSFSSLGLFGLNVLFVNPDMNLKLMELHNYVKENSLSKEDTFSAHTTLLIDEPDTILKILPDVTKAFSKIEGKITSISLYEFFPARFIKRIELRH